MAEVQYATNGKGNLGVTLGAIGTGLGALAGAGGLAGLLGMRPGGGDPGDRPVTRHEMDLYQIINDKNNKIVALEANQYSDKLAAGLQMQIGQQAVWNATQTGMLNLLQNQVTQLSTLAKLGIPENSITVSAFQAQATPTQTAA